MIGFIISFIIPHDVDELYFVNDKLKTSYICLTMSTFGVSSTVHSVYIM